MPVFAVSIGAMIDGSPVVGVIYDPAADLIFTAIQGGHALMNDQSIKAGDDPISLFVSVGIDSHWGMAMPPWLPADPPQDPVSATWAPRPCRWRTWPREAWWARSCARPSCGTSRPEPSLPRPPGRVVTDWQGRPLWPMDLAGYDGYPIPCIAANPTAHRQLLAMIKG